MMDSRPPAADTVFSRTCGELRLTNIEQLAVMRAVLECDAEYRTTVRGFSMHPFIRDADVVTICPLRGKPPRVGEVVAFSHPRHGRLIIHRLIENTADGWLAQGDNCDTVDGNALTEAHILGRVIRVERQRHVVRGSLGGVGVVIAWLLRRHFLPGVMRRIQRIVHRLRRLAGFVK